MRINECAIRGLKEKRQLRSFTTCSSLIPACSELKGPQQPRCCIHGAETCLRWRRQLPAEPRSLLQVVRTRPSVRSGGRCSSRVPLEPLTSTHSQLNFSASPRVLLRRSRCPALASPCPRSPRSPRSGESTCPESGHTSGMDALKSAGRAIIKSPGVPRHTWGTSKHESE